jgi:hypothetical protein
MKYWILDVKPYLQNMYKFKLMSNSAANECSLSAMTPPLTSIRMVWRLHANTAPEFEIFCLHPMSGDEIYPMTRLPPGEKVCQQSRPPWRWAKGFGSWRNSTLPTLTACWSSRGAKTTPCCSSRTPSPSFVSRLRSPDAAPKYTP